MGLPIINESMCKSLQTTFSNKRNSIRESPFWLRSLKCLVAL